MIDPTQIRKPSLEAAAAAAAKVNAMLIAKGKLKVPQAVVDAAKAPGQMLTAEVEINEAPLAARTYLTRGATQDEITKLTGASVTTKGRYLTPTEKSITRDRPLYLLVQASTSQQRDGAVDHIHNIVISKFGGRLPSRTAGGPPSAVVVQPAATPATTSAQQPLTGVPGMSYVQEKMFIGLEHAPPSFDVKSKILGPGGSYLNHVNSETGCRATLRGRGSGTLEPISGHESYEPLHVNLQHATPIGLQQGKNLVKNLIETVQQEFAQFQQALAAMPPTVKPGTASILANIQQQIPAPVLQPQTAYSSIPTASTQYSQPLQPAGVPTLYPQQYAQPAAQVVPTVAASVHVAAAVQPTAQYATPVAPMAAPVPPTAIPMAPVAPVAPVVAAAPVPTGALTPVVTPAAPVPALAAPIATPVAAPVVAPVAAPSLAPVAAPSLAPVAAPSLAPVAAPSLAPVAAPSLSTSYADYVRPTSEPEPKRRFTEEKPKEEVPSNLLGYQHGPPHLTNLVSSSPPPESSGQDFNKSDSDSSLMPPPPPPAGAASVKKSMPPPSMPPPSALPIGSKRSAPPPKPESPKRLKGSLGSVAAYGSDDEDSDPPSPGAFRPQSFNGGPSTANGGFAAAYSSQPASQQQQPVYQSTQGGYTAQYEQQSQTSYSTQQSQQSAVYGPPMPPAVYSPQQAVLQQTVQQTAHSASHQATPQSSAFYGPPPPASLYNAQQTYSNSQYNSASYRH